MTNRLDELKEVMSQSEDECGVGFAGEDDVIMQSLGCESIITDKSEKFIEAVVKGYKKTNLADLQEKS